MDTVESNKKAIAERTESDINKKHFTSYRFML